MARIAYPSDLADAQWKLIVKRSDDHVSFAVLPKRWIVERTFGWIGQRAMPLDLPQRVIQRSYCRSSAACAGSPAKAMILYFNRTDSPAGRCQGSVIHWNGMGEMKP